MDLIQDPAAFTLMLWRHPGLVPGSRPWGGHWPPRFCLCLWPLLRIQVWTRNFHFCKGSL